MKEILKLDNVKKYYGDSDNITKAVDGITFKVNGGEFVAIMGASGSGKTTLLNVISTIDKATSGQIFIGSTDITQIKEKEVADFRKNNLGFIFQDFNLLDTLNIEENISLSLIINGENKNDIDSKVRDLAKKLGIEDILQKFPYEVSGGQKQRAAVARALITNPQMILADEPTGALDSKAAESLLSMFQVINQEGQTILMVTHSIKAASCAKRVLFIKDGQVFHQIYKGSSSNEEMYQKISDTLTVITTGGGKHE